MNGKRLINEYIHIDTSIGYVSFYLLKASINNALQSNIIQKCILILLLGMFKGIYAIRTKLINACKSKERITEIQKG